ncbi:unnamed protein product [Arctogadus glacialis]
MNVHTGLCIVPWVISVLHGTTHTYLCFTLNVVYRVGVCKPGFTLNVVYRVGVCKPGFTLNVVYTVGACKPGFTLNVVYRLRSRCAPKSEAMAHPAVVHVARTRSLMSHRAASPYSEPLLLMQAGGDEL